MNKNFNLNSKINSLYNKIYDNVVLDNVVLDNVVLDSNLTGGGVNNIDNKIIDPNLKIDLINEISRGKFKYIKNGKNSFVIKRYSDNLPVNMIISKDSKSSNVDSTISNHLSELVMGSKTKHILLPILNLDLKHKDLKTVFKNNNDLMKRIDHNGKSDVYNISLKENFFKGGYLKDIVNKQISNFDSNNFQNFNRNLFFQLIHTLGVIKERYPNFSHNNLGLKSIFIYNKKNSNNKYNLGNNNYKLKNINFDIKLSNFKNSKIDSSKNVTNDLDKFIDDYLDNFYKTSSEGKLDKNSKIFFSNLKSKINSYKKNSRDIDMNELLNDEFFSEFISNKKSKDIKSKVNGSKSSMSSNSKAIKTTLDKSSKKMFGAGYLEELGKYGYDLNDIDNQTGGGGGDNEQTGGFERNQVPFKREKNTPFLTNEERETFGRRKADNPPPPEPPILAEQKVYDTSKMKSQTVLPQVYPPAHIPVPNPYMPNVNPYQQYAYGYEPNQIPVQKYYNISMSSPVGNHSTLNRIYEDMLPVNPNPFTMTTIYERKQLLNYFRNMLLEYGDGEEFSISPGPKKSLLSYIRLIELNPYTEQKNPYHGLATDFMLYNAAYPIKYEQDKNHLAIVKNPIGLNIRLYKLSKGADKALQLNNNIGLDDFEALREIKYYEYIRENVIKTKTSPNFISLYLYTKDSTSRLNYDEINLLKYQTLPKNDLKKNHTNNNLVNNLHVLNINQSSVIPNTQWPRMKNYNVNGVALIEQVDLNKDQGMSLIGVTEAPNNNIIKWASPLYQSFGAIQQEVETGYHNVEVWRSIIFQLVYTCAVLEEAGICFENLSLLNNFYIKDLYADPGKRNHWIYKVNNHEFYVPNYGYLLVFDSNFADIFSSSEENLRNLNSGSGRRFKIHSDKLYTKNSPGISSMGLLKSINQFKSIVNPDIFNNELKKMGGQSPDNEILILLKKMYDYDINDQNNNVRKIRDYLKHFFPEFLHNRVGSLLTKDEKEALSQFPDNNFSEGELVVYQERYGEFKWAIFVDDEITSIGNLNKKKIRIDHSSNPISVFASSLYKFPEKESIQQDIKNGIKLDTEFSLETYNLDNLIK